MSTKETIAALLQAVDGLRGTAETLLATQKRITEDVAEMSAAVVEATETTAMLADAVQTAVSRLGSLFDRMEDMEGRMGRYIADQAKQDNLVAVLRSEVREVQRKVG